jgi:hypothetical protein
MLLIALCAIAVTLMLFEHRFIYHPQREHDASPETLGLRHVDMHITTRDHVRLHAWLFPRPSARATVLYLHGNAGNISHRLPKARALHALGLAVMLVDYRGYGRSEGHPSEVGTYRDAGAAFEALATRTDVDRDSIICFGESLGGAVAIDLATRVPCRALIIESSFTSLPELASEIFPIPFARYLLASRYDSRRKLPSIRAPVLFIHGTKDDLVPFAHAERNFAAANDPKDLFAIAGAGHNDPFMVGGRAWSDRIDAFVKNVLRTYPTL